MSDNFGLEIGCGRFRQQPVHQRAERRMRGGGGDGLIGQARIAGIAREGHELAEGGTDEGAGVRHQSAACSSALLSESTSLLAVTGEKKVATGTPKTALIRSAYPLFTVCRLPVWTRDK
jgi:hypothetical protein